MYLIEMNFVEENQTYFLVKQSFEKHGNLLPSIKDRELRSSDYIELLKLVAEADNEAALVAILIFLKSLISETKDLLKNRSVKIRSKSGEEYEIKGIVDIENILQKIRKSNKQK